MRIALNTWEQAGVKHIRASGPPHINPAYAGKKAGDCRPSQSCSLVTGSLTLLRVGHASTGEGVRPREPASRFTSCPLAVGTAAVPTASMVHGSQAPATGKAPFTAQGRASKGVERQRTPIWDLPERMRSWQNSHYKEPAIVSEGGYN